MYGLWGNNNTNSLSLNVGGLYICNTSNGPVNNSTIVEITSLDYINDFLLYRTTDSLVYGNCTIGTFQSHFIEYKPHNNQIKDESKCECGLKFITEGGRHSDWCPLYEKF